MNSCSTKAQAIRLMMDAVTKELGLTIDQIAPVNLKQGFEYNVEDGLIPSIFQQLEQAKQVRYLRCLKVYHIEDYWHRLWKQSKRAGQFIAKKGFSSFDKSALALSGKSRAGRGKVPPPPLFTLKKRVLF
jgi:hypothetical protein